jgi:hypothetical protein
MKMTADKFNYIAKILMMAFLTGTAACTDHPKQQEGEVALDTTAGQDNLYIDTTSDISYGISGDVDTTGTPDLDTLKYIDKGVKPEDAFKP